MAEPCGCTAHCGVQSDAVGIGQILLAEGLTAGVLHTPQDPDTGQLTLDHPELLAIAIAIVLRESDGWSQACNDSNPDGIARGWAQIYQRYDQQQLYTPDQLYNPQGNSAVLWAMYQDRGWEPWAWNGITPPAGLDRLPEANAAVAELLKGDQGIAVAQPAVPPIFGPIGALLAAGGDALQAIAFGVGFLTNPHNWLRLGMFLAAAVLVLLAVLLLAKDALDKSPTGQAALTAATKGAM